MWICPNYGGKARQDTALVWPAARGSSHVLLLNGRQELICYTPETGALLGTLLCEDFCLFCTTPFTDVLGVLIEYKKINKSLALRSKFSTFKESNHTASTVQSTNKLEKAVSLTHVHSKETTLCFRRGLEPKLVLCWRITLVMLNLLYGCLQYLVSKMVWNEK